MRFRPRYLLATALGLWSSAVAPSQEPGRLGLDAVPVLSAPLLSSNQLLANRIAASLRQGGQLRNYRIDVACEGGLVELTGIVMDQAQADEAIRLVQGVPGVERVVSRLNLSQPQTIIRTQAGQGAQPGQPDLVLPPADTRAAEPKPTEPMPLASAPLMGGPYDLNPPKMPPFAWPTYSPYPNMSRVAYPEAYPYNAWPYIGPVYPFPRVPLGWRSVKLEWESGYWWFSRVANKHDWWRLKYW